MEIVQKKSLARSCRSSSSIYNKRCAFTRKCTFLVKEQRARFYIMGRCVTWCETEPLKPITEPNTKLFKTINRKPIE
uniref:Uncharacterized protein LOC104223908 n=1 Tax=Nicotiana sylvestris TaxID=4096 RepID=A0A1U7W957_NICSY|nr:PREDICTED: uncharacterized protein LOC104223908 [Nicotiana sylvestris]